MSRLKEKLMYGVIIFLVLSNVFFIGKMLNEKENEEDKMIQGFLSNEEVEEENDKKVSAQKEVFNKEIESGEIIVNIGGACVNPGVYEVDKGARVYDVLKMAGGELKDADLNPVNLAKKLKDEEKIYIPFKGETAKEEVKSSIVSLSENSSETALVNINTADKAQLMELPGIGDKTAEKILSYRESNYFEKIEDIMNVSGIGEKKFEDLKELITVQ